MNSKPKTIGLIGGMGPYAGLDVLCKIYKNTIAEKDKDHLEVVHISLSSSLPDRSEFLLGQTDDNPGEVLARKLDNKSIDIIGIACNTFHAPAIFDVFVEKMKAQNESIQIIHLPQEVYKFTNSYYKKSLRIGLLSSLGTAKTKIYKKAFQDSSHQLIFLDHKENKEIHRAIYHPEWGIKAIGELSPEANEILTKQVYCLIDKGVDSILLGCTELPMVKRHLNCMGLNIIDPNLILARALIREVDVNKLTLVNSL
ncbi:MAG: amino acid racemase [Bacteroidota bacterium]